MGFVMSGGTCSLMLYAPGCMLRHVRARRAKGLGLHGLIVTSSKILHIEQQSR
jgi:hypothetical protein